MHARSKSAIQLDCTLPSVAVIGASVKVIVRVPVMDISKS